MKMSISSETKERQGEGKARFLQKKYAYSELTNHFLLFYLYASFSKPLHYHTDTTPLPSYTFLVGCKEYSYIWFKQRL